MRCINKEKTRVVEGEFRFRELTRFLDSKKTIKAIWISEDATAIIPEYKYDPETNQIVGILLPKDKNGCPIPFRYILRYLNSQKFSTANNLIFSFIAKDAETIKEFVQDPIKNPKSKNVYVVMAQVLDERVPPFILQIFGTNSTFTACDTIHRWHYIKDELEKYI